jgi:regulatory protein
MEKDYEKAKNAAIRYLSYRSRSIAEVTKKLQDKEFSQGIIKQTIDFLLEYKFINDQQFARDWIANRNLLKPMGRKRLSQELYLKGISQEIIDEQLSQITDEDEIELIKQIIIRKIPEVVDEKYLAKVYGKLLRRGFNSRLVSKLVKEELGSKMY